MMDRRNKDLDYYMSLPWTWTVEPYEEEGKHYFLIRINELPGVVTDVADLADAESEVNEVIAATIELYLKQGEEIPEPVDRAKCKGNIHYRTSPDRHYKLLMEVQRRKAAHEGGSLSRLIDELVDDASFMRKDCHRTVHRPT